MWMCLLTGALHSLGRSRPQHPAREAGLQSATHHLAWAPLAERRHRRARPAAGKPGHDSAGPSPGERPQLRGCQRGRQRCRHREPLARVAPRLPAGREHHPAKRWIARDSSAPDASRGRHEGRRSRRRGCGHGWCRCREPRARGRRAAGEADVARTGTWRAESHDPVSR
jgi:hypothetical protein